jgi:hypothetical protein
VSRPGNKRKRSQGRVKNVKDEETTEYSKTVKRAHF